MDLGAQSDQFSALTAQRVGEQLAIADPVTVLLAPTVQQEIAGPVQIAGTYTEREIHRLAAQLTITAWRITFDVG